MDTVARRCGFVAPAVAVGAIVLATIIAAPETFTWHDRALSDMGRTGTRTFWLFNGGLIVAGVVGIPFVWRFVRESQNRVERAGAVLTGVAVVGMIGVGIFFLGHTEYYLETDLHGIAALTVFGVAPVAQFVAGAGQVVAGDRWLAIASFWFGIVQLLSWIIWLGYRSGAADPWAWFAVPEMVAAVAFAGWIVSIALTME